MDQIQLKAKLLENNWEWDKLMNILAKCYRGKAQLILAAIDKVNKERYFLLKEKEGA